MTLLVLVASCGCASVEKRDFASRFVREGTPSLDFGGPRLEAAKAPRVKMPKAAITTNVSRFSGTSLESTNPALQSALGHLLFAPTIRHHIAVSRAYQQSGIMDHAMDYLNRSLEVNGPSAEVYEARARLWRDWELPQFGLTDAHRAVYLAPESASYHNTLGTLLHRLGDRSAAEDQFQHALRLNPNAWYALANLCHVNLAQGKTREAIALCHRATTLRNKQQPKTGQDTRP